MTHPARRLTPLLAIVAAVVGVVAVAGGWATSHHVAAGAVFPPLGRDAAAVATADDRPGVRSATDTAVPSAGDRRSAERASDDAHELGRAAGQDAPALRRLGPDPRHVTAHAAPVVVVPAVVLLGLVAARGRVAPDRAASLWRALVDHALRRGPPPLVVA